MNAAATMLGLALLAFAGGALGEPATGEIARLEAQIQSLRDAQATMLDELRQIKALIQKPAAPSTAAAMPTVIGSDVSLDGARMNGAPAAPVVVVEFSDFQCPFCARHATGAYREILRTYVDTGRIRYAFIDFPIDSLHPHAFKQHVAAACAADQGRFWPMHDRLFAHQQATESRALAEQAVAIGLDAAAFRACIDTDKHAEGIRLAMRLGTSLGVAGTPTFLIGFATPGGKVRVVQMITDAKPFFVFQDAIDAALATAMPADAAPGPARAAVVSSNAIAAHDRGR